MSSTTTAMDKDKVIITVSNMSEKQTFEWPILHRTEKAIQVSTVGGVVWLPLWQWRDVNTTIQTDDSSMTRYRDEFLKKLAVSTTRDSVKVTRSGKGATLKSGKFKVKVIRKASDSAFDVEPGSSEVVERCFTLPVSQIFSEDGELRAPIWLFKNHLEKNERLVSEKWDGIDVIAKQIDDVFVSLKQQTLEHNEKRRAEAKARLEATKARQLAYKNK